MVHSRSYYPMRPQATRPQDHAVHVCRAPVMPVVALPGGGVTNNHQLRCAADILATRREHASRSQGAAVMNQRAIWLGSLTAFGLLAILLSGIILIPHLLYPALTPADLRGVVSAQARVQL